MSPWHLLLTQGQGKGQLVVRMEIRLPPRRLLKVSAKNSLLMIAICLLKVANQTPSVRYNCYITQIYAATILVCPELVVLKAIPK